MNRGRVVVLILVVIGCGSISMYHLTKAQASDHGRAAVEDATAQAAAAVKQATEQAVATIQQSATQAVTSVKKPAAAVKAKTHATPHQFEPRCANSDLNRPECSNPSGCRMMKCAVLDCPLGATPLIKWQTDGCRGCFECVSAQAQVATTEALAAPETHTSIQAGTESKTNGIWSRGLLVEAPFQNWKPLLPLCKAELRISQCMAAMRKVLVPKTAPKWLVSLLTVPGESYARI